ncbi:MAG: TolC family protein [Spirochaetales bacterium]|nr:TolC family protein [Spirochaetales bacterium]
MRRVIILFLLLFPIMAHAQISIDIDNFTEILINKNIEIARQLYKLRETEIASRLNYLSFVPKLSGNISGNSTILENNKDMIQKNLNITISQLIFNGGRTIRSLDASKDAEENELLKLLAMVESEKSRARNIFYEYLLTLEKSKILQEKVKLIEQQLFYSKKLREMGKTTELESENAEINYGQAILSSQLMSFQLQTALSNIHHELGLARSEEINIVGDIYELESNSLKFETEMKEAILSAEQNNLKIRISNKILSQMQNTIYNFNTIALPEINADLKLTAIADKDIFDQFSFNFIFRFNFPIPILPLSATMQIGRGIHNELNSGFSLNFSLLQNLDYLIKKEQIDKEYRFLNQENILLKQNTRLKIEQLYQEIEFNQQTLNIIQQKIVLSEKKVEIYKKMHELGKITNIELFSAINSHFEAKLEQLSPIVELIKLKEEIKQIAGIFNSEAWL